MKPAAKKGLIVVGVLYAVAVGIMAYNLIAASQPTVEVSALQERLNDTLAWAQQEDPDHVRATPLTENEVRDLLEGPLAARGTIISVNYTLIMQVLNFAILLLLLYGLLWEPVLNMLEERRRKVQGNLDRADEERRQAEALRQERRRELDKLRAERTEILDNARTTAQQQRAEIVEQAHEESNRMIQHTRDRLDEEVRRARIALREDVAALATDIAGRVLQREVQPDDHDRLIQEMVEQMTLQGHTAQGTPEQQ